MVEAVRTSKTSVNFNITTGHYITQDSNLHTRRSENLTLDNCIKLLLCIGFLFSSGIGIRQEPG
jgi:hypothetical protein